MKEAELAELRKVFGDPLEPESWHDGKVLRLLAEREELVTMLKDFTAIIETRGNCGSLACASTYLLLCEAVRRVKANLEELER